MGPVFVNPRLVWRGYEEMGFDIDPLSASLRVFLEKLSQDDRRHGLGKR